MPTTPLAVLGLGFVLGIRHSLDIDHLAAISAIVSQRRSALSSALVGAVWGLGHTAALLVVAIGVIPLRMKMPPVFGHVLELGVAAMLVGLGVNLLYKLWSGASLHHHAHDHGGRPHVHPHLHVPGQNPEAHHRRGPGRKPFLIGLLHGLAGSAGLMLAVLTTIPRPGLALAYVAIFGSGSIGGMMIMSTLLGAPMALLAGRFAGAEGWVRATAAVMSVAVGLLVAVGVVVDAGVLA